MNKALRQCKCGVTAYTQEDLELFSLSKNCTYGRRNTCKACNSAASRKSAGYTEPKKSAPKGTYNTSKERSIYARYGLSAKAHKELLAKALNCCEICQQSQDLVVDHDHLTGKVRGILCRKCNTGLGLLQDNLTTIKKVVKYLEKPQDN